MMSVAFCKAFLGLRLGGSQKRVGGISILSKKPKIISTQFLFSNKYFFESFKHSNDMRIAFRFLVSCIQNIFKIIFLKTSFCYAASQPKPPLPHLLTFLMVCACFLGPRRPLPSDWQRDECAHVGCCFHYRVRSHPLKLAEGVEGGLG